MNEEIKREIEEISDEGESLDSFLYKILNNQKVIYHILKELENQLKEIK